MSSKVLDVKTSRSCVQPPILHRIIMMFNGSNWSMASLKKLVAFYGNCRQNLMYNIDLPILYLNTIDESFTSTLLLIVLSHSLSIKDSHKYAVTS